MKSIHFHILHRFRQFAVLFFHIYLHKSYFFLSFYHNPRSMDTGDSLHYMLNTHDWTSISKLNTIPGSSKKT